MKRCPICNTSFPDDANFCPNDASKLVSAEGGAAAPAAGDSNVVSGRFKLGAQIGGHQTGQVFAAQDTSTGQACAVKLIAPAVMPTPLIAQRTERELKQLSKVTSDRVGRVLDAGKHQNHLYVAMETCVGQPLWELVLNGPLPPARALHLAREIGEALAEAAKVGVIHRDVAPKNVLVGDGDKVKVLNFSVPVPVNDKVFGVPEYLSPEQAEGKAVDQRSNIYSLGAVLYFLVTGEAPFVGEPAAVIQQQLGAQPVPPSQRTPGTFVPPDLEKLILKSLEKQSSKRHLTLRQMLSEMETVATSVANMPAPVAAAANLPPPQLPVARAPTPPPPPKPAAAVTMMGMASPALRMPDQTGAASGSIEAQAPAAPLVSTLAGMAASPPIPPPQYAAPPPPPAYVPPPAPPPPPQFAPPPPVMAAPTPPPYVPPPAPVMPAPQPPPAAAMPPPAMPAPAKPAAPSGGGAGKGKGKGGAPPPAAQPSKGKFRETMWFKKGELDEAAAAAAAAMAESDPTVAPSAKADEMPMEDRYGDDGSLSRQDAEKYSLRTGATQMMSAVAVPSAAASVPGEKMGEEDLVKELKAGRGKVIAIIAVALVAILGIVTWYFASGKKASSEDSKPAPTKAKGTQREAPAARPTSPA